jgi:hypothetical protein
MINMTNNIRQWENQMRWKRQGRSWIKPPSQQEKLNDNPNIKLRPLGNSFSSLQYVQPFIIWTTCKIREHFRLDE